MRRAAAASVGRGGVLGIALAVAGGCDDDPIIDPSTVETADLGVFAVDPTGVTEEIVVPVPEDAVSLTLVATNPTAGELLFRIAEPGGRVVTSDLNICSSFDSALRVYPQPATSIALVPNSDAIGDDPIGVPLLAGEYRVRIRSGLAYRECRGAPSAAPGTVGLRALWKRLPVGGDGKPGPLRGQRLAVNVFLVGGIVRTAMLDRGLGHMRGIFATAGVYLSLPHFYDIGEPEAARFARVLVDDDTQMRSVFALSAMAEEDGVNIFIVRDLVSSSGWTVLGIASGIPGTPERGGERAGVLASSIILDPRQFDAGFVGAVLAHETGHFLGLYHTTEASWTPDQINDTPSCLDWHDRSRDGLPNREECLGEDGNNLMFWEGRTFGDKEIAGAHHLTPGQAFVIRRSAATR